MLRRLCSSILADGAFPLPNGFVLAAAALGAHFMGTYGVVIEIGLDAHILPRPPGAKPPLLVLQIGETGRADHFSLNGYDRPTNTELAGLGVLSFRQVTWCGTNTAASLPCMFSALGKSAFESRQQDSENLLDLVQHAGMAVLWVDNQASCKSLAC